MIINVKIYSKENFYSLIELIIINYKQLLFIGALIVYDISRRQTFLHITSWLEEAKQNGN